MAVIFSLTGRSQVAVRVAQALLDTLTVFVIYLLARRACRIASPALAPGLAAVLPFTGIYAAYLLSEALATFASAVTLLIAIAALDSDRWPRFLTTGLCLGILVLIRPDFALLPVAAVLYFAITLFTTRRRTLLPIALISIGCLAILTPWTIRNALVLGTFQPLSKPFLGTQNLTGARVNVPPTGFFAWIRTWHADLSERDRGVWPYETQQWDRLEFPDSAFDTEGERLRVLALIQRARTASTPERQAIEDDFAALARERAQRNPIRMWLLLPLRRAVRLWVNSRTEAFPLPAFSRGQNLFSPAVALKVVLATANLTLVLFAVVGAWASRRETAIVVILAGFIIYRTAVHAYFAGMEARYVLEAFPALYVLTAEGLGWTAGHIAIRRTPPLLHPR